MRDRERMTAEQFGILEKLEALETDILKVHHVADVEFDLDGFYDNIFQVILVPRYDIPVTLPDYFAVRKDMLRQVLDVAKEHGLNRSGDSIEDYGEHYYIVRTCDDSWRKLAKQAKEASLTNRLADALGRAGSLGYEVGCEKEHNGLY